MDIVFADTFDGELQDRACSILLSLSMLSDTARNMAGSSGNMRKVYYAELTHQYDRAVHDSLRLLGIAMHNIEVVNDDSVTSIREIGPPALMDILRKYERYLDIDRG